MAWKLFSVFVGACVYVGVAAGVGTASSPVVVVLGLLGALFLAVAVGSWVATLPSRPVASDPR